MAKVLRCRDVGVDCDFEARGNSVEDILKQAEAHAKKDHGFPGIPPALLEQVKAAIRDE
ncbi:MAG: DUF1059 domain-containing protein [Acidobacteria bacterium]|nr:DUF1059 domain-containing protein [Acidobacteriota bacterium]